MKKIGFLSHKSFETYPEPLADEVPVVQALRAKGYAVDCPAWDDDTVNWQAYNMVIVRTCWNYMEDTNAFLRWLAARNEENCPLYNSPKTILWNINKNYLLAWEAQGFRIAKVVNLVGSNLIEELKACMEQESWQTVVLKPAVGAASKGIWRVDAHALEKIPTYLDGIALNGGVLVQAFYPEVLELGLMFFDGVYTHSLRKRPTVWAQVDNGVYTPAAPPAVEPYLPTNEQIEIAQQFIDRTPEPLLYGRVDGFFVNNQFLLTELEYFEPELYFRFDSTGKSIQQFIAAIEKRLQ